MKNQNILLQIITLLSFTVTAFSCSKQEILSKSAIENAASKGVPITAYLPGSCPYPCTDTRCKSYLNGYCGLITQDTLTVVSNSNNVQETVGITHNQGMYSIMPHYANGALYPTDDNVRAYTKSFLVSKNYDSTLINSYNNYYIQTYGALAQMPDINTQANTLYTNGTITASAKTYLNTLSSKLNAFCAGADSAAPTQTAYNTFANSLVTLENQIKNSTSLTTNDKYILNCAYSTARYSTVYAVNYAINNGSYSSGAIAASSGSVSPMRATTKGWFSVTGMCGADVAGAALGATYGVVTGLASGGVLTPATIATESLAGCISGSVYSAASQVWSHFFGN